jgi:hypothetical protein
MSEERETQLGVSVEWLAQAAVGLLTREPSGAADDSGAAAAAKVRWLVATQLAGMDSDAVAAFDEDPADPDRQATLAEHIGAAADDDPDFARQLLVYVNSDCALDPAVHGPDGDSEREALVPLARWALGAPVGPVVRLTAGIALFAFGLWLHSHYGPLADACRTGLGALARATDVTTATNCDTAEFADQVWWLVLAGGAVFAGEGGFRLARRYADQGRPIPDTED